jgi:hypothetical protein
VFTLVHSIIRQIRPDYQRQQILHPTRDAHRAVAEDPIFSRGRVRVSFQTSPARLRLSCFGNAQAGASRAVRSARIAAGIGWSAVMTVLTKSRLGRAICGRPSRSAPSRVATLAISVPVECGWPSPSWPAEQVPLGADDVDAVRLSMLKHSLGEFGK